MRRMDERGDLREGDLLVIKEGCGDEGKICVFLRGGDHAGLFSWVLMEGKELLASNYWLAHAAPEGGQNGQDFVGEAQDHRRCA